MTISSATIWVRTGTLAGLLGCAMSVGAQAPATPGTPKKDEPAVEFKHNEGKARIFDLDLNHGQRFVVRISGTCPDAFDYSHEGVERGTFREQSEGPKPKKRLEAKDIPVVYDQQYGGYVFHITLKKDVKPGDVCTDGETLASQSFIVSVRQQNWNVAFSGAFTISGLNDPVYSFKTESGVKFVQSEPDKENGSKLGAASFVHLFHDRVKIPGGLVPALGFGLGINSDKKTEYMIGGALRFGDKATINIGRVWGSIDRLPNGVTLDTPVTDDNLLNNLGSQTVSRWFFALGYAFIDTKDRLTKPFAPDTAKADTTEGETGEGANGAGSAASEIESVAALTAASKDVATYASVGALKAVLQSASGAKTICSAIPSKPADKALEMTVNVKGASADDLTALNKEQKAAADAVAAAAKASLKKGKKTLGVAVSKLTFAAVCQ